MTMRQLFIKHEKKLMFLFFALFCLVSNYRFFLYNLLPSFRSGHDLGIGVYPLFHNFCSIIRGGEIPFWSNYLFCGLPIYCFGYFSILNPILYLAKFLEPFTVYKIYLWFLWTIAGFFMYLLLRARYKIGIVASIIGSLWYALMPVFAIRYMLWFINFHFGIPAFLPIIFLYFTAIINSDSLSIKENRTFRNIAFCSIWIMIAAIFGGNYYIPLLFLCLFAYFVIVQIKNLISCSFSKIGKQSFYTSLIFIFALGLLAFQFLPFLQYLKLSSGSRQDLPISLENIWIYLFKGFKSINPPIRPNIFIVSAFPLVVLLFCFLFFNSKNKLISNLYYVLYGFISIGIIGILLPKINYWFQFLGIAQKINFEYLLFFIDFVIAILAAWHIDALYFRKEGLLWNKVSGIGSRITNFLLGVVTVYYGCFVVFILAMFGIAGYQKGKLFLSPDIQLSPPLRMRFPKTHLYQILFFIKEKIFFLNHQFGRMEFLYPIPFLLVLIAQIVLLVLIVFAKHRTKESLVKTALIFIFFFVLSATSFRLYWYQDAYDFFYNWYKRTKDVAIAQRIPSTERIVFFESRDFIPINEKYKILIQDEKEYSKGLVNSIKPQMQIDERSLKTLPVNVSRDGFFALRQLAPLVNDLRIPNGYVNLLPSRISSFLAFVEFEDSFINGNRSILMHFGRQSQFSNINSKFLDLLGCRFLFLSLFLNKGLFSKEKEENSEHSYFALDNLANEEEREKGYRYLVLPFKISGKRTFGGRKEFNFYFENRTTYPKAWLVYSVLFERDETSILRTMLRPDFDLKLKAIVEDRNALLKINPNYQVLSKSEVKIIKYNNNSLQIKVDSEQPALLVINDSYYPGWRASINGNATKIFVTDYMFRSILLPKGQNMNVKIVFDPLIFKIGLLISCSVMACIILFLIRDGQRRKSNNF